MDALLCCVENRHSTMPLVIASMVIALISWITPGKGQKSEISDSDGWIYQQEFPYRAITWTGSCFRCNGIVTWGSRRTRITGWLWECYSFSSRHCLSNKIIFRAQFLHLYNEDRWTVLHLHKWANFFTDSPPLRVWLERDVTSGKLQVLHSAKQWGALLEIYRSWRPAWN